MKNDEDFRIRKSDIQEIEELRKAHPERFPVQQVWDGEEREDDLLPRPTEAKKRLLGDKNR